MRFLHAADIHLDSPMAGLQRYAGAAGWGNPTRRAFVNLIDLAISADVAFVVIAGDVYDGDWKDHSTGLFFAEQMRRLDRPCILVRGNHDAASVITQKLRKPPNVFEFEAGRAHEIPLPELGVVLHGRSYPKREVLDDISRDYPARAPGMFNIGVLHTSAEDPGVHKAYAPCSVEALRAKGYDYWALGHVHEWRELSRAPWVVFPGNTQGRHVNEAGAKGAALVEVQDGAVVSVEHAATDVLRWVGVDVDLTGADGEDELWDRARAVLSAEAAAAGGRPVIARVRLGGATDLHAPLAADLAQIRREFDNAALAAGDVHIESVRLATTPVRPREDQADLRAAFVAALDDPAVSTVLLKDFARLAGMLPGSLHGEAPGLPSDEAALRAMLPLAWEAALNELGRGDP